MRSRDASFSQTDWSMIGRLQSENGAEAAEALDRLVRRYWPAVFAYIRRSGRSVDAASDLTQSFIGTVVLERGLLHRADPSRGRVRSLLKTALENFLAEAHRYSTRKRRAPSGRLLRLDDAPENEAISAAASPEGAFDAAWARTMVQNVLRIVRAEVEAKPSLRVHWLIFEARVVRPALHGVEPVPYSELARRFQLPSATHAANLAVTIRRRFALALRHEVAATVSDVEDVEAELAELLAIPDD